MFGHLVSKQAQVIGGGAMPSGTLESTLIISRARALASKSTLHEEAKNASFGNHYVRMYVFIFVQCMPKPPYLNCFPSNSR